MFLRFPIICTEIEGYSQIIMGKGGFGLQFHSLSGGHQGPLILTLHGQNGGQIHPYGGQFRVILDSLLICSNSLVQLTVLLPDKPHIRMGLRRFRLNLDRPFIEFPGLGQITAAKVDRSKIDHALSRQRVELNRPLK